MAADEFLLETSNIPTLRFFVWDHPQITFGYFGEYLALQERFTQQLLTRRWTGGGVVFHGDDITFSLVIPANDPLAKERGEEIYRQIHSCVRSAFLNLGLVAGLANHADAKPGGDCFAAPVAHDVIGETGKLAGGAMRRTRAGLLYQGSILGVPKENRQSVATQLRHLLSLEITTHSFSCSELEKIQNIATSRYASQEWLMRPTKKQS